MNQLSDRLNSLSPSATLAMSQKSAELKAQGVDVINLSVGTTLKRLPRKQLTRTTRVILLLPVILPCAMPLWLN